MFDLETIPNVTIDDNTGIVVLLREVHQVFANDGVIGLRYVDNNDLAGAIGVAQQCDEIRVVLVQFDGDYLALTLVGTTVVYVLGRSTDTRSLYWSQISAVKKAMNASNCPECARILAPGTRFLHKLLISLQLSALVA